MARVFLDCHIFSQDWFKNALRELVAAPAVIFVYSQASQMKKEISAVRQALQFYKVMSSQKNRWGQSRCVIADFDEVNHHISRLEGTGAFSNCSACDDPHIFAMIYVKPTRYVFSHDVRMAACRDKINKTMDKRYCDFVVISNSTVYAEHRPNICAP